jgi:hypothetical protein
MHGNEELPYPWQIDGYMDWDTGDWIDWMEQEYGLVIPDWRIGETGMILIVPLSDSNWNTDELLEFCELCGGSQLKWGRRGFVVVRCEKMPKGRGLGWDLLNSAVALDVAMRIFNMRGRMSGEQLQRVMTLLMRDGRYVYVRRSRSRELEGDTFIGLGMTKGLDGKESVSVLTRKSWIGKPGQERGEGFGWCRLEDATDISEEEVYEILERAGEELQTLCNGNPFLFTENVRLIQKMSGSGYADSKKQSS